MSTTDAIDAYLAGVDDLRRAVAGMTPDQVRARPVPGTWSTLEVVCHLADFEPVYADRMKRLIAEDEPILFSADERRYAAALAYHDRDLGAELDLIERTRRNLATILRRLPPEAWSRVGVYRHEGEDQHRTLGRFLELVTGHIHHHIPFILEKRKALGLG